MWQVISPNSSSHSEPIELTRLKYQLANNSCKCKICVDYEKSLLTTILQESKETQIEDTQPSLVRITNKFPDSLFGRGRPENVFCPGCWMMALNVFQNKDIKVLKDEESETNNKMFSCDKSTEKNVRYLQKATCMANILIPKYSDVTFCDTTEYSNDISLNPLSRKQRNMVSFIDSENENRKKPSYFGNCLCMENFIDSIRPPLVDCDI